MDTAVQARPRGGTGHAVRAVGLVVAIGVLVLVFVLSLWVGSRDIPFASTWHVLLHNDGSTEAVIIHDLRVPRGLMGLLVGGALGLAGALMQALTRNPLADPGLLGVEMGAATAVVVAIAFTGVSTVTGYIWFAFAGAAAASVLVYVLGSSGRSAATPERLVLAGAAITAVLVAFVSAVLVLDTQAFNSFRFWDVGALAGRKMDAVAQVAPFILVGVALALGLARSLNVLALGDQTGKALGANLGRTRALGALAVTLLCGAATAAAGPIAFIGLTIPHVARMIAGSDQRWVLPYSLVLAPILLIGSDVVGRVVIAPAELQVGIVTAFLGAPVFIALCRRRKLAQL
ncbi:FecCD family ABC transporter permease [Umezawaea tangerina]|uniref:Iron complex transport system permease protein n=1 Tax=Umezawaea tangerina TaxID=84725 RepID=A0A2T0SV58_9PSEU|nr:iron chelate uptake ABC transporter family permease subunit [Umezawaea tangerina]PRY37295.1 iron complex transport system permease protein [Umezawaea tangerina]